MKSKALEKMIGQVQQMIVDIETIKDAEQEKYDAMSEKAQEGEKGERRSQDISELESLIDSLSTAESSLDNLTQE